MPGLPLNEYILHRAVAVLVRFRVGQKVFLKNLSTQSSAFRAVRAHIKSVLIQEQILQQRLLVDKQHRSLPLPGLFDQVSCSQPIDRIDNQHVHTGLQHALQLIVLQILIIPAVIDGQPGLSLGVGFQMQAQACHECIRSVIYAHTECGQFLRECRRPQQHHGKHCAKQFFHPVHAIHAYSSCAVNTAAERPA